METGVAIALALVGMFVAAIGVFFFGEFTLMFAIMLIGVAILALATEMESPKLAPPGAPAADEVPASQFCASCGTHYPADYKLCPKDGMPLKALV